MPTIETFLLPDLGEGLTEADLLSWSVAVGDTVELNQIIAEVETVKASVELPSPYAGTVVALHAEEGWTVDVGSAFIDIETDDDAVVSTSTSPAPITTAVPTQKAAPERTPVLVGYGVAEEGISRRRRGGATPTPTVEQPAAAVPRRPLATPPVRFAAKKAGIDLAGVSATGSRGQVTRADLDLAMKNAADTPAIGPISAAADAAASTNQPVAGETRTPIKGVRKHTAAAMVRSAFTAPHVTEFVDVDVTPMMELVNSLRENKHFAGVRLTPLALVSKALLVALHTNPSLNSYWDDDAHEIVTKFYVNLGIAAATPRGLMVPNIKNAHALGLRELALALSELTRTAKDGKTGPADLADGTITITNVGVFGVDAGTPILNPGEAAILCFGSIRRRPWEHNGDIVLRSITTLSLSFDHRLVDGEQGSKFLAAIADILSDPLSLIALS
ncbi:MAG: dihydrolipoamide acetyltransferase family protein [Rhodococcus sp. (in: high G+C Gram-positive bacteria)]|jgi:2-oxoisovalerate dehydrogenase E2 component (dihydrolipoyl transacylase)